MSTTAGSNPPGYDPHCLLCNLRRYPDCLACHAQPGGQACPGHRTPCGIAKHPPARSEEPRPAAPEPAPEKAEPATPAEKSSNLLDQLRNLPPKSEHERRVEALLDALDENNFPTLKRMLVPGAIKRRHDDQLYALEHLGSRDRASAKERLARAARFAHHALRLGLLDGERGEVGRRLWAAASGLVKREKDALRILEEAGWDVAELNAAVMAAPPERTPAEAPGTAPRTAPGTCGGGEEPPNKSVPSTASPEGNDARCPFCLKPAPRDPYLCLADGTHEGYNPAALAAATTVKEFFGALPPITRERFRQRRKVTFYERRPPWMTDEQIAAVLNDTQIFPIQIEEPVSTTELRAGSSQLENALAALARGFKIFPCEPRSKAPAGKIVPHGVSEATRDEAQLRAWWARNPDCNPGVTGGVIVDCDTGLHSLEEAEAWRRNVGLPPTLAVRTGRRSSYGIQFHLSGETKNGPYENALQVSGEIRCYHEYGLAPGAIHPDTGERYEVVVDLPLAPWPATSQLEELRKETTAKLKQPPATLKLGEKIKRSSRQYWLVARCGALRNQGMSGKALFAALRALCDEYCERPQEKTDAMLRQICESGERNYGVHPPQPTTALIVRRGDEIELERLEWYCYPVLVRKEINVFAGMPDEGKGVVVADLVARVTSHRPFPNQEVYLLGDRDEVLMLSGEETYATTVLPRIKVAGGDLARVHAIKGIEVRSGDRRAERVLALGQDVDQLRAFLQEHSRVGLVVIDPVDCYFGPGTKKNDREDARTIYGALKRLAEEFDVTILLVDHLNKDNQKAALHRISGAGAAGASPRSAWLFGRDREQRNVRHVVYLKANHLAEEEKKGWKFQFQSKDLDIQGKPESLPVVHWLGRSSLAAETLLARQDPEQLERTRARRFLEKELAAGPRLATDLYKAAEKVGISERTLRRAREDLKIIHDRPVNPGPWYWGLPHGPGASETEGNLFN